MKPPEANPTIPIIPKLKPLAPITTIVILPKSKKIASNNVQFAFLFTDFLKSEIGILFSLEKSSSLTIQSFKLTFSFSNSFKRMLNFALISLSI